jgi:hypothetical protein
MMAVLFILALKAVFLGLVYAEQQILGSNENKNGILTRFESESAVPQVLSLAMVLTIRFIGSGELIGLLRSMILTYGMLRSPL